jgi:Uma2 family endonuclease
MSIAPLEPRKPLPPPPFYGPDGLYRPPAENGELPAHLPGHLELPEENGEIVENFREAPQNVLLDTVILPILERLHPDLHFALGHDCGIYWRLTHPPERGAICPDWFYVPGVPPLFQGDYRRSYVLWKEHVPPAVLIEYSSEDGTKERDRTPYDGKFWVYEQAIRGEYYAIFVVGTGELEVHRLAGGRYHRLQPDEHGHYPIEPLGVALGVWHGLYLNETAPWLRWYDLQGNLLPLDAERAAEAQRRAEEERTRAEEERTRAEEERTRAEEERTRAEEERTRAEQADRRAAKERARAEQADRRAEQADRRAAEERARAEAEHRRAQEERGRTQVADQRAEEERARAEAESLRRERLAAKLRELGIDPEAV